MARPILRALFPLLLLFHLACSRENPAMLSNAAGVPLVRVRLLQSLNSVTVAASQPPTVRTSADNTPRPLQFPNSPVSVSLDSSGWRIGSITLSPGVLTIQPAADGSVAINGRRYRGQYRFVPVSVDRFDVINDVDVDGYLMSVVSKEMLRLWDAESYRAQAIAARTYALYEARTTPAGRGWDVYDDQRSQVYGGISAETDKSINAVQSTRGIVLAYGPAGQERIFKAYFSSCCGGIGQSAYDAFGDPWSEPLSEQNHGTLCSASPKFNWGPLVIAKDELTRRVRSWGMRKNRPEKDMALLANIEIQARNRLGRPVRFVLTDIRGARYSLSGEETRTAINSDAGNGPVLYSSFFRTINDPEAIRFVDGHGHGHGAGMCQWCAQAMAERGYTAGQIVLWSYPRSKLVKAY